jgi:hypothetical protein
LFQAAIRSNLVGKDLSILVAVLGASVYNVQARVITGKGGVDDCLGIAGNIEEAKGSIGGVEAVDMDRMDGFCSSWAVR